MNGLPEYDAANDPHPTQASGAENTESSPNPEAAQGWRPDDYPVTTPSAVNEYPFPDSSHTQHPPAPERPMFESWYQPPQVRIPHLGHLAILGVFAIFGMVGALVPFWVGLRFHWFGVTSLKAAATDIHYTLGSEAVLYLVMLGACMLFFPMIWNKGFFAGIQWNGATALRLRQQLFLTAAVCFALALVNGLLLPGPKDAPIDKIFRTPGAAWLLFGFGVTIAPFAEELIFRGFLLPALCTACDWINEKTKGVPVRPLDENGQPQWSLGAMVIGSVATSVPFAAMHAAQTGYAFGPFILLVGVSLALCWARLSTRSLASSVLVHASYNFLLFALMMLGTGGFRHLDKM
ncbi:MAG TPA: type II CAAX endopeptidase family protein [Terracidiphilus sp.]|nr:type II CAAX endopeptidase family protein [Terracidiphilus sp.]